MKELNKIFDDKFKLKKNTWLFYFLFKRCQVYGILSQN